MFRHDIRRALRTLRKNKVYAGLNIVGLAVGMACCLLILAYVFTERRYDRHHEHADRIYRVVGHYTADTGTRRFARTQPAVAPNLERDLAEVEQAIRLQRYRGTVRYEDRFFREDAIFFADADVFSVFTIPLLRGDPATALQAPYTVVLTEAAAARYFGARDPMGQTIALNDTLYFEVTGIARDASAPSHLAYDFLASFATQEARRGDLSNVWRAGVYYTYALLARPEDAAPLQAKLPAFLAQHLGDQQGTGSRYSLHLQALTDIHLHSDLRQELQPNGSSVYVNVFAAVALFILLIACINFMNLATARSQRRVREVGVRKAVGARRGHLVRQFMTEAVLISAVATVVAVVLAAAARPAFGAWTGRDLAWGALAPPPVLLAAVVALALLVGLLAGSYPALFLATTPPIAALKGWSRQGGQRAAALLRKGLVVFQFALSIFLIIGMLVAVQQVDFMRSRPLGFDEQQVLVVPFLWDPYVQGRYDVLKEALLQEPAIHHVTASGDVPGRMFTEMGYWAEGMPTDASNGITALVVDPDFAETYNLTLAAGRDFSPDLQADLSETFVLNVSAAREMGWTPEEAVGKAFRMNTTGQVIGVVEDFHVEGLQKPLEPLVMTVWPSWFGYISVRINTAAAETALAAIEQAWTALVPNRTFEAFFLDEDFDRQYRAEQRFGQVFVTFALLAIFIACLGLLGLAIFTAERRTKEIGIRKALGASTAGIVMLLAGGITRLVGVALVVAAVPAYLAMHRWLEGFAHRITLSGWIFVLAGVSALAVAWLTIGYQAVRAAQANPVDALRYE